MAGFSSGNLYLFIIKKQSPYPLHTPFSVKANVTQCLGHGCLLSLHRGFFVQRSYCQWRLTLDLFARPAKS
jgi:hypothetical protein